MSERVILAGSSSGSGKTTVACAALGILKACSLKVKAFKCGPDYIDPMFHLAALGASSENLDGFLCGNETLKYILSENSRGFDISVIEGAMGYYDGVGFTSEHSSYELSKLTGTPVIIIIDCAGIGATLGATLNGLVKYKSDSNIRGVIFNRISEQLYSGARELAENMGIESVGYLPKDSRINLESRHLGLKTAAETVYLQDKMKCLFNIAEKTIDVKKIISIASAATEIKAINKKLSPISENVVIAVANDNAFCFMYEDNLRVLSELGCDICFFSPLDGEGLPDNISGMYLGGGYPELYAKELSENAKMRESIFDAANRNMPFIA
ncbi:MAG: cobyrinate a,c-diamide synthase, partial [Eubacterium sp.]|nr:cobyrinate a,c-diamide synthase [Eubacterium sp.]